MKTIQLSDKIYKELKELAQEIKTQDNRATANVFFQIQDVERMPAHEGYGDVVVFYNSDSETEVETDEEKRGVILEYLIESLGRKECEAKSELAEMDKWDIDRHLRMMDFEKFEYKLEKVYKNAFLTEKEALRHLKANKHHYSEKACVYGSSAWRNYDIEEIRAFLKEVQF